MNYYIVSIVSFFFIEDSIKYLNKIYLGIKAFFLTYKMPLIHKIVTQSSNDYVKLHIV
jgi:hypothetical protein